MARTAPPANSKPKRRTKAKTPAPAPAPEPPPPPPPEIWPDAVEPLPDPIADRFPIAQLMLPPQGELTSADADTQRVLGDHLYLDGNVEIHYRDIILRADHIDYDRKTHDATATGHLVYVGTTNGEHINASHGTMNLRDQTGRFYDIDGYVAVSMAGKNVFTTSDPIRFTGREIVKTGVGAYEIYDGTLTTCEIPKPDWQLYSGHFTVDARQVRAHNTVFRLMNLPVLFLPYVTHPRDPTQRQSGFLIPFAGQSSSKGFIVGEEIYWAISRSTDLFIGAQYYSKRGWEESANFRHRGRGNDFFQARYSGLLDRGYTPTGGTYINQGGEDAYVTGRHDFSQQMRIAATAEYLSSFAYREAFASNFNTAVSTDIESQAYFTKSFRDMSLGLEFDRYQGLKRIAFAATATSPALAEQQVRIFHAPSIDFSAADHQIGHTGLLWTLDSSLGFLKRVQPNFATGGIVQRLDIHPRISYPVNLEGWQITPYIGARETAYTKSRTNGPLPPGAVPTESTSPLNRADFEAGVDIRPPVLERTFSGGLVEKLFGRELKHTIEPSFSYHYVEGIHNFQNVLRFDERDVAADTNEMEYGVTQRLFLRPGKTKPCVNSELGGLGLDTAMSNANDLGNADTAILSAPNDGDTTLRHASAPTTETGNCNTREVISWRLTQKTFFDQNFGGAVQNGRRNVLDTTLALSGIAFLTEPRAISPLISRLRVRTSDRTDVEWDLDFDTGAKKLTSSNVLVDSHIGQVFGALSYARLNAPGRTYVESPTGNLTSSSISNFSQMRILLGYGIPTRPGLSMAGNAGLDLNSGTVQYGALQTNYNWNCCGFSVEYRKYELGQAGAVIRNENSYRFNFTLANIGSAGNLRRTERLF